MKSFFFLHHFQSHSTIFRQNQMSFLGCNGKQFKFANIFNFHVNQHRGYARRQSCSYCQQAPKHIINPVVTREPHWSCLRKLQKREKPTGNASSPSLNLNQIHVIELNEMVGPSTLSNIQGQNIHKIYLSQSPPESL